MVRIHAPEPTGAAQAVAWAAGFLPWVARVLTASRRDPFEAVVVPSVVIRHLHEGRIGVTNAAKATALDPSAYYRLDLSRFPLVWLTMRGDPDVNVQARMFAEIETMASAGRPYVMVGDLTHARPVNASSRQAGAAWRKDYEERFGHLALGVVLVVPNALIRSALIAVNWISGHRYADVWVASAEEAETEALAILARHDLVPPDAEEQRAVRSS